MVGLVYHGAPERNETYSVTLTSFNLPLDCLQSVEGSATTTDTISKDLTNDMMIIADASDSVFDLTGKLFLISAQSYNNGITTFKIKDTTAIFDDLNKYNTAPSGGYYTKVSNAIAAAFIGSSIILPTQTYPTFNASMESSAAYIFSDWKFTSIGLQVAPSSDVLTFLEGIDFDTSNYSPDGITSDYVYNFGKFLRYLRNLGVEFNWKVYSKIATNGDHYSTLLATISYISTLNPITIPFDDGHSELKSTNFDGDYYSAVEIATPDETYKMYSYAYNSEGELGVRIYNNHRGVYIPIQGKTGITSYEGTKTAAERLAVAEAFMTEHNVVEHNVSFYSDRLMHAGQLVKLILPDRILDTAITKVMVTSDDNRYYYEAGEGTPATLQGFMGANKWRYGSVLPINPKKGTLMIVG